MINFGKFYSWWSLSIKEKLSLKSIQRETNPIITTSENKSFYKNFKDFKKIKIENLGVNATVATVIDENLLDPYYLASPRYFLQKSPISPSEIIPYQEHSIRLSFSNSFGDYEVISKIHNYFDRDLNQLAIKINNRIQIKLADEKVIELFKGKELKEFENLGKNLKRKDLINTFSDFENEILFPLLFEDIETKDSQIEEQEKLLKADIKNKFGWYYNFIIPILNKPSEVSKFKSIYKYNQEEDSKISYWFNSVYWMKKREHTISIYSR